LLHGPYPFVLSPAAVEKLRFVHEVVEARPGRLASPSANIP
jgi:hypothetical protein